MLEQARLLLSTDLFTRHSATTTRQQLELTLKWRDLMSWIFLSTYKSVVLVCDVTNLSTLTHAAQWLQDAQDANPGTQQDMMVMLVVNKRDMVNDTMFGIVEVKARQMCLSLGAEYWAVSAKTGECVEDFFRRLAALVFNAAVLAEVGSEVKEPAIKIGDSLMCDANGNANREVKKRGCKDNNNKCG